MGKQSRSRLCTGSGHHDQFGNSVHLGRSRRTRPQKHNIGKCASCRMSHRSREGTGSVGSCCSCRHPHQSHSKNKRHKLEVLGDRNLQGPHFRHATQSCCHEVVAALIPAHSTSHHNVHTALGVQPAQFTRTAQRPCRTRRCTYPVRPESRCLGRHRGR